MLRDGGAAASESDTGTPKLPPQSSPAGWPGNGEYVEGYKTKKYLISHVYNRETTVNDEEQPLPDVRLRRMRQHELEEQREVQAGIQQQQQQPQRQREQHQGSGQEGAAAAALLTRRTATTTPSGRLWSGCTTCWFTINPWLDYAVWSWRGWRFVCSCTALGGETRRW